MTSRRLLLGDWTPVIRDGIDLLRIAFVAGTIVFLVLGNLTGAGYLGFAAVATILARVVQLPRLHDLSFALAMVLTGFGEAFGLYDSIRWYDNMVHFLVPLLGAPVAYIGLARLDVVPDPKDETHLRHYAGIFVITLAVGLAIGAVWEVAEWSSDRWLGSDLSMNNDDTVIDLVADGSGSVCGAALLVAWARHGWGSVRRISGQQEEAVEG